MNKKIKLLILIVLSLSVYFVYKSHDSNMINYVSLGDGFAKGMNSYQQPSYGYSDYLKNYLDSKYKLESYNDSFSYQDMMTRDIKKDIIINTHDNNHNSIKFILREANLLTISVGINDFIYEIDVNKPLTDYKKEKIVTKIVDNFAADIKEIKKYYKNDIYVIGYYNFYPQNSVERNLFNKLNIAYKEYCEKNELIYVDNNNINKSLSNYLENPESFYPNVNGYEAIYKNILKKLEI